MAKPRDVYVSNLTVVAILSAVLAVATWYAWHEHPHNAFIRAWGPNVGTALASAAIALTVVEWFRQKHARDQLDPLLCPVLGHINSEFSLFIFAVADDYAITHNTTFKPLPTDPLELLRFWLDEQDAADLPHIALEPGGETLRDVGYEFARQVRYHEEQLGSAMEPSLRAALRSFARAIRIADQALQPGYAEVVASMPEELAAQLDPERRSYRTFVSGAYELVPILRAYHDAPVLREVDPEVIAFVEEHRRRGLAALDDASV